MTPTTTEAIYVLHVDDDPEFGELAGQLLEREDDRLEVYTVTDPYEGLAVLREWDIDCVLSDYDMDGLDGTEFRRAVHAEHPELPFVLFTARRRDQIPAPAIAGRMATYYQKRCGEDQYAELADRIRQVAERERADWLAVNRQ